MTLSEVEIEKRLALLMGILNRSKNNLSTSAYRLIESHLRQIAVDETILQTNFSIEVQKLINSSMLNPKGGFRL